METNNIITLITDFGLEDPYVGQVKGAILHHNIQARMLDISHAIPSHDILSGAVTLRTSYHYYPRGTTHMCVVDPGVGSKRAMLAAAGEGHLFIAPDNGILSLLMTDDKLSAIYRVENSRLFPSDVSSTFHGRDIMAPVAAALAGGMPLSEVGPETELSACASLHLSGPEITPNRIKGQVLHIDHFGNIRTTITSASLSKFQPGSFTSIELRGTTVSAISTTYTDCPVGGFTGIIDSSGYLEIAVNRGNAANATGSQLGDPVTVFMEREESSS